MAEKHRSYVEHKYPGRHGLIPTNNQKETAIMIDFDEGKKKRKMCEEEISECTYPAVVKLSSSIQLAPGEDPC